MRPKSKEQSALLTFFFAIDFIFPTLFNSLASNPSFFMALALVHFALTFYPVNIQMAR